MTTPQEVQATIVPTQKKHGCLFYGCMTVIVIVVVGGTIIGFGTWYLFKYLKDSYTASVPLKIEQVQIPKEEIDKVHESLEGLKKDLDEKETPFDYRISSRDIQAIMQFDSENAKLSEFLSIEIIQDEIHGKWSAPLPVPFFGIRFFNGEGYGTFSYSRDKGFICNLREININGSPLSPDTVNAFCEKIPYLESNIPTEKNEDEDPFTERIESLQIKNGAIELKFGEIKPKSDTK